MSDPMPGDIVREKKYSQPLEVIQVYPPRKELQTQPQGQPTSPKKWQKYDDVVPYKKEGG